MCKKWNKAAVCIEAKNLTIKNTEMEFSYLLTVDSTMASLAMIRWKVMVNFTITNVIWLIKVTAY